MDSVYINITLERSSLGRIPDRLKTYDGVHCFGMVFLSYEEESSAYCPGELTLPDVNGRLIVDRVPAVRFCVDTWNYGEPYGTGLFPIGAAIAWRRATWFVDSLVPKYGTLEWMLRFARA